MQGAIMSAWKRNSCSQVTNYRARYRLCTISDSTNILTLYLMAH